MRKIGAFFWYQNIYSNKLLNVVCAQSAQKNKDLDSEIVKNRAKLFMPPLWYA